MKCGEFLKLIYFSLTAMEILMVDTLQGNMSRWDDKVREVCVLQLPEI